MIDLAPLAAALCKAQAEFGRVIKDKTARVGAYSYTYADLDSVLDAIRPALTKHGLALVQSIDNQGPVVRVSTNLLHLSGAMLSFGTITMQAKDANPQSLGSAITYARRYGVAALGIAPEEDDDAQAAQDPKPGNVRVGREEMPKQEYKSRLQKAREDLRVVTAKSPPTHDADGLPRNPLDEPESPDDVVKEIVKQIGRCWPKTGKDNQAARLAYVSRALHEIFDEQYPAEELAKLGYLESHLRVLPLSKLHDGLEQLRQRVNDEALDRDYPNGTY